MCLSSCTLFMGVLDTHYTIAGGVGGWALSPFLLPSFLPSFLLSFLPSLLLFSLPFLLPSFLPSFLPSSIPPSFPPFCLFLPACFRCRCVTILVLMPSAFSRPLAFCLYFKRRAFCVTEKGRLIKTSGFKCASRCLFVCPGGMPEGRHEQLKHVAVCLR